MRLFLKEGNVFKVDEETNIKFITLEDFYFKMTNVPKPIPSDFVCSLEFIINIKGKEYNGQYNFWPNSRTLNTIDESCLFEFKFLGINYTRDDLNKYIEFDIIEK
jgi:hypothetical protein